MRWKIGIFTKIFDLGKHGLQLTDDFVMRLKNKFASNDPNVVFSCAPFLYDDMERLVEMCSLEMYLSHNVNINDKVIIIADTRHTHRWSEREVVPMLWNRDLAFFCNCPTTYERTPTKCGRSGNSRICPHVLKYASQVRSS